MVRVGLRCALLASALLIGITSASQSFDPHEPSGEVVQLTDENFDKLTECELPWFIAVTAPWCALVVSRCWRGVCGCRQMWNASTDACHNYSRPLQRVQVHALPGPGADMAGGGAALERGGACRQGE